MKKRKSILTYLALVFVVTSFYIANHDVDIHAKTKKIKWTATIAKKTYKYTGKKIKPKVTVKYKGKKLPKKNYKVKYPKNPMKKGQYKIKVSLKGKYKGKKLKGTKTITYKIYRPKSYDDKNKYNDDNEDDVENEVKKKDTIVTKNVKGISIAYSTDRYPFYRYTDKDKESGKKKDYAQCYFPIFIKQKVNKDFILHTEYKGKCGFNNFSNCQYIPNRKDAQVVTSANVYYYYEDDLTKPYDNFQQDLYKKGYIGFIMVKVSCLLDEKQSVDVYLDNEKLVTLQSDRFSKLEKYNDYDFYYQFHNPFLAPAYSYTTELTLKNMLNDVAKCNPKTDFETYTALKYWITSHAYTEYTCWASINVGEAMTELGYPYIKLACSYDNGEGWIYNDYSRYYSLRSKLDDVGYSSGGHRVSLIFMNNKQFWWCEVQGRADEDEGYDSSKKFVFDPSGWTRPDYDVSKSLSDITSKMPLNEYSNIKQLVKGDYEIDIEKYDAFDWHTWKNYW